MKAVQFLSPALLAAGAALLWDSASAQMPGTALEEQFCQVYYSLDDGNCNTLRQSVRSEIRGSGTPTLELGDPTQKPVLLFFHGWPDTYAMWANQFARFCGKGGEYACVATSMMDYNPDVEPADVSKLSWPLQADVLHEVVTGMGLKDITLVLHDFGSIVGSMYVARHPDVVKRVVAMDVGNSPAPNLYPPSEAMFNSLFFFQQNAIIAFREKNDTKMFENVRAMSAFAASQNPGLEPPCADCSIAPDTKVGIGYKTGWMHRNFVNEDPAWTSFFAQPYNEFDFAFSPTWPDHIPQLFLHATEGFHHPSLLTWLDGRGDGSRHAKIGHDHWFMVRSTVAETNDEMAKFFDATSVTQVTCGEIKDAYKSQQCCGNPGKQFTFAEGRHLMATANVDEQGLLADIENALENAKNKGGSKAVRRLAELIRREYQTYL